MPKSFSIHPRVKARWLPEIVARCGCLLVTFNLNSKVQRGVAVGKTAQVAVAFPALATFHRAPEK
jgi:hypothetical protein